MDGPDLFVHIECIRLQELSWHLMGSSNDIHIELIECRDLRTADGVFLLRPLRPIVHLVNNIPHGLAACENRYHFHRRRSYSV